MDPLIYYYILITPLTIFLLVLIELSTKIYTVSQTIQTLNSLMKKNCYLIVTYLRIPLDGNL